MVAVKIVEHSHFPKDHPDRSPQSDPTSSDAKIAREMLLSTSISHPNIIATYKICTIRVGNVPDSGSLDSHEVCACAPLPFMIPAHGRFVGPCQSLQPIWCTIARARRAHGVP